MSEPPLPRQLWAADPLTESKWSTDPRKELEGTERTASWPLLHVGRKALCEHIQGAPAYLSLLGMANISMSGLQSQGQLWPRGVSPPKGWGKTPVPSLSLPMFSPLECPAYVHARCSQHEVLHTSRANIPSLESLWPRSKCTAPRAMCFEQWP